MPTEGERAPDFTLAGVNGAGEEVSVNLSELTGKPVVLYFYPKDNTPGCTTQACGIRDAWPDFGDTDAVVLGVSPDDVASHRKFRDKYDLPFTLLADTDHEVAERYGVWKEKSMFGRKYMGVDRTTFVIDADGTIARIFRKVKPRKHAEDVLEVLGT
ncbi:MAG TPA: thioredoxin-dependent thiol peroxidase [Longimicrobiales bacterium]|nr:thioredoxin-dependent thiol peroxidase [Longimicrobiales bacterium]